jgi:hypothetical protein
MKKKIAPKLLHLKKETLINLRAGMSTIFSYPCPTKFQKCEITPVLICELE